MELRDPTVTQAMQAWQEDQETRDQAEKTAHPEQMALQEKWELVDQWAHLAHRDLQDPRDHVVDQEPWV